MNSLPKEATDPCLFVYPGCPRKTCHWAVCPPNCLHVVWHLLSMIWVYHVPQFLQPFTMSQCQGRWRAPSSVPCSMSFRARLLIFVMAVVVSPLFQPSVTRSGIALAGLKGSGISRRLIAFQRPSSFREYENESRCPVWASEVLSWRWISTSLVIHWRFVTKCVAHSVEQRNKCHLGITNLLLPLWWGKCE